ncbi:hypothetical protein [Desulfonatronum thioautotrophicum]|uniref:hypothetical protein n=1 Tax=Desulfonatronum thioautotrophicum TaxID=617001 RepID=UPI0012948218|nr:hypothetical protein [Desulfonatronum thioautotrophicum]
MESFRVFFLEAEPMAARVSRILALWTRGVAGEGFDYCFGLVRPGAIQQEDSC